MEILLILYRQQRRLALGPQFHDILLISVVRYRHGYHLVKIYYRCLMSEHDLYSRLYEHDLNDDSNFKHGDETSRLVYRPEVMIQSK